MTHSSAIPDIDRLRQLAKRVAGVGPSEIPREEWRTALAELARHLREPMSLAEVERIEAVLKAYLRRILQAELTGDDARFIARWQRDLGFLLKYKSYGVKCATPLGYAVFLLNPGEGFSFQRHLTRKTEIFLILEPLESARVFLCTSQQWEAVYERTRFAQWLEGAPDEDLQRLAVHPRAGDVYHVSELGVVHSVLGCVLEEFATVSTDMVDRLHDQNAGRPEPRVARDAVMARLRSLAADAPRIAPLDDRSSGFVARRGNVQIFQLATNPIEATRCHVERGSVELTADPRRARSLFIVAGSAECELRGIDEAPGVAQPPIDVRGGDILLIPPGIVTTIEVSQTLAFSVHAIEPELALA